MIYTENCAMILIIPIRLQSVTIQPVLSCKDSARNISYTVP